MRPANDALLINSHGNTYPSKNLQETYFSSINAVWQLSQKISFSTKTCTKVHVRRQ